MEILEVIIAILLLGFALWLFIRAVKSKKEGVANCDSCSAKCSNRNTSAGCSDIQFIRKEYQPTLPKK